MYCESAFVLLTGLATGTTLWRDPVPATGDGVISLPGQRGHNARASRPLSHQLGFRLGGGSGLHAPGCVQAEPSPGGDSDSHAEPGAGLGFRSLNLRPQQESR